MARVFEGPKVWWNLTYPALHGGGSLDSFETLGAAMAAAWERLIPLVDVSDLTIWRCEGTYGGGSATSTAFVRCVRTPGYGITFEAYQ